MYSCGPPIASGYRGSKKNATLEDYIHMNHNIATRTSNATFRYNTNFGRTTRVATNTTNNLRSYFTPVSRASQGEGSNDNKGHGRDKYASARSRHSHRGSTWQTPRLLENSVPNQCNSTLAPSHSANAPARLLPS
jgi:hypothetical protein